MRALGTYAIVDEPRPGRLARLAVRPYWPLLAAMVAGGWLAWPWFGFNARALGAPARGRTYAWIAAFVVGTLGFVAALDLAATRGWISTPVLSWAVLPVTLFRLTVAYVLFEQQEATSELFVHFGGRVRNGAILTVLGTFLGNIWVRPWAAGLGQGGSLAVGLFWVLL